jgi:hypothetical protein
VTFAVAAALSRSHVAIASSCGLRERCEVVALRPDLGDEPPVLLLERDESLDLGAELGQPRRGGVDVGGTGQDRSASTIACSLAALRSRAARYSPAIASRGRAARARGQPWRRRRGDRDVEVPDPDVDSVPRGTLRRELASARATTSRTRPRTSSTSPSSASCVEAVIRCDRSAAPRVDVAGELAGPGLGARVPLEAEDLAEDPLALGRRRLGESVRLALGEQDGGLERVGVEPEQLAIAACVSRIVSPVSGRQPAPSAIASSR